MPRKFYEKYKSKGEFLCKLAVKNVIINDLSEDRVNGWKKSDSHEQIRGLCSIEKKDIKYILNKEKKRAEIPIIREDGEIEYINVPVYYSKNTGYCYIYKETVQRLKTVGVINCKLIKAAYEGKSANILTGLNTESVLYQYGYNVAEVNHLTEQQRRTILISLIQQNILQIEEIKNHLAFLINVNQNVFKMKAACKKWKNDFYFLDDFEEGMFEITKPAKLIVKNVILKDS